MNLPQAEYLKNIQLPDKKYLYLASAVGVLVLYKALGRIRYTMRVGKYNDRYILVTGCDSGFGYLVVQRLDKLGCHVYAGCLTEKGETELQKLCSKRTRTFKLDVTNQESVRNALEYVKGTLPEGRGLWGVLNNAGILEGLGAPDWYTINDYHRHCDVNLFGLIDVTLVFLPLVKKEKGRVVNVSSMGGRLSVPMMLPYCVSKYGVEAFTDGLRRLLHYFGCRAILVEPGFYKTPLVTRDRINNLVTDLWQKTAENVKEEYGEAFTSYVINKQMESLMAMSSSNLMEVVGAYEHALLARYPRARYMVGTDAKYVFYPLTTLSESTSDWILRRFESDRPLPALATK